MPRQSTLHVFAGSEAFNDNLKSYRASVKTLVKQEALAG
jgi:hypothetical protein